MIGVGSVKGGEGILRGDYMGESSKRKKNRLVIEEIVIQRYT